MLAYQNDKYSALLVENDNRLEKARIEKNVYRERKDGTTSESALRIEMHTFL